LSDFLLWECAYAELVFSACLWPDFGVPHLEEAVAEFRKRERRFGLLPSMDSVHADGSASNGTGTNATDGAAAAEEPRAAKDAV
jgi:undecaprenyl diphosphate synthase